VLDGGRPCVVANTAIRRYLPASLSIVGVRPSHKGITMLRDVILWLAGVPIFVIILLHLFGVFH
jgi:hypothetical protein